jgi:hypothetical protein
MGGCSCGLGWGKLGGNHLFDKEEVAVTELQDDAAEVFLFFELLNYIGYPGDGIGEIHGLMLLYKLNYVPISYINDLALVGQFSQFFLVKLH